MSKRKVMHIVEGFGGGVYTFLVDLCNKSVEKYDITLVYSKRPQTPENFKKDFDERINLIELDMNRSISPIKDIKNLFSLIKMIKGYRPNIIHLHSSKAGVLGRISGKLLGYNDKQILYNPHGYAYLQRDASAAKRKIYFLIEKTMSHIGGTVIAVSKSEYEETLKFTEKAKRVDNAINEEDIDRYIDENVTRDRLVIGTVGRICYQKNPKVFNDIANAFSDVDFVWIGDGELKESITSSNIEITGWCKREEVIKRLNDIDIYIQTSLWEGLPIALLEAMYMGKVPIVSNVIGNKDVILQGENGFLAKTTDEFIQFVKLMLNDSDKYKKMSINSKKFIQENHLIKDMIRKYHKIYESKF